MTDRIKAWHFSTGKLAYGDDRPIVAGETHTVTGGLVLCESGLHASKKAIDALSYRRGCVVSRVELHGTVIAGSDKLAASHRTYLAVADATEVLRKFARLCALDVVHLWDAPDIVKRYIKTGDETLRLEAKAASAADAYAAYYAAASASASAADAAASATYAAYAYAAYAAYYASASASASAAASATRKKMQAKQNKRLTGMLNRLIQKTT